MLKEFEGKTEKEAIDRAIDELGIDREEFDVEIVETSKKGIIFKKGSVKIRVHVSDEDLEEMQSPRRESVEAGKSREAEAAKKPGKKIEETESEGEILEFVRTVAGKMGFPCETRITDREDSKLQVEIISQHSNILIGKKGKNLDALQLLANVYAGKIDYSRRVILDTEGYRGRREDSLQRLARKTAEQVSKSRGSRLLEPMNPFERRLIHTALNDFKDVDTKSEGEGLYKQVRIYYRGTDRGDR
ncbi:MAG: RNA-binding cell elongation regulator Jag/EloR [Spirochaetia bacterium]